MEPITRVNSLEEFLQAARLGEYPVVYTLKEEERYDCHKKWTDDFLEHVDVSVGIHRACNPSFFDFNHSPIELARSAIMRQTTVGDLMKSRGNMKQTYWEMISGTDTHLCVENGPVQRWSNLWNDCSKIEDIVPAKLYRVGFWISCGRPESGLNLSSQMHWDVNGHHNLNFQVRGEKSVIMFSPDEGKYLYPMPARLWHLSRIDPRNPNISKYPLFSKARALHVNLVENDVLLIPSGWWHHVTHKGKVNVNLTYWYHSKERSGIKWGWSSLFVSKPLEAWFFGAKLVVAICFCLPPLLLQEILLTRVITKGKMPSQVYARRLGLACIAALLAASITWSRS